MEDNTIKISIEEDSRIKVTKLTVNNGISNILNATITFHSYKNPFSLLNKYIHLNCTVNNITRTYRLWVYKINLLQQSIIEDLFSMETYHELFQLTLSKKYQTFSNYQLSAIAVKILEEYSISFQNNMLSNISSKEIIIQYGESDWDFFSRIMTEEGNYFFVKNNKLILSNSVSSYEKISTNLLLLDSDHQSIYNWCQKVSPYSLTATNYNFKTSPNSIEKTLTNNNGMGNYYIFPHQQENISDLENFCQWNISQINNEEKVISVISQDFNIEVGRIIELEINGSFESMLCNKIIHNFIYNNNTCSYGNEISLVNYNNNKYIPAQKNVNYLPSLTAFVVSPFKTDKFLRIPIQFPWDKNKTTHMIRVLNKISGPGYGTQMLPGADQEVVIDFINGSYYNPIITGTLYNINCSSPYDIENTWGIKTISSNNDINDFNEIFINNTSNEELFRLQAQKDMNIIVKDSRTDEVQNSDFNLKIDKGNYIVSISEGSLNIECKNNNTNIKNNCNIFVEGQCEIESKGSILLKSSSELKISSSVLDIKCNDLKITSDNTSINSPIFNLNVDGDLKIKSSLLELSSSLLSMSASTAQIDFILYSLKSESISMTTAAFMMESAVSNITGAVEVTGILTQDSMPVMVI